MFDDMSVPIIIVAFIALVVIGVFIMTLVWSWVVPDVFSGMVTAELLPAKLTLWQGFKLMVFLAMFNSARVSNSK